VGKEATVDAIAADEGQRVLLRIPAKAEYISLGRLALTGLARVRPLPDEVLADLKLALTEACSNSVRHAYEGGSGVVDVVFDLQPGGLAIEVSDDGPGFAYEEPAVDAEDLSEGGLGIAIIRALVDDLELGGREAGGGSRLRFVKRLP
jgi:serine/threonine-protein kinase RsbW